jgi:hypothetical protein
MAERVGFEPAAPTPINDLGQFSIARTARNARNLSIRYKTGAVKSSGFCTADRRPSIEFHDASRASRCIARCKSQSACVGSGNSGRWIPEILAPSPETLAV